MAFVQALGYAGGGLLSAQSIPQIVKVVRNGSAGDLSYASVAVAIMGAGLSLAYGLLVAQPPVWGTAAASLLLNGALGACKAAADARARSADGYERLP